MNYFTKIEEYILGILILVVSIVLIVNIAIREFTSGSITWSEEFIRYGIIYITFIGMGVCFRKGMHVGVDLLMTSLKHKGKRVLQLLLNVLAIIFMVFLVIYGFKLVMFSINSGQITPSLKLKTWIIYLAIPLGGLLSLFHLAINTIQVLKNPNIFLEEQKEEWEG